MQKQQRKSSYTSVRGVVPRRHYDDGLDSEEVAFVNPGCAPL
jgi:hypothetical protein